MRILYLPFLIQGLLMSIDEFHYHRRRGLPLWERIGHPIDTLSVLMCFGFLYLRPANLENLYIYIGLSLVSCLLVTKDEHVHTGRCSPGENWLHALLFMLHPLVLACAGYLWLSANTSAGDSLWFLALPIQITILALFILYQIIYWGFLWKTSTTPFTTPMESAGTPPSMIRSRS